MSVRFGTASAATVRFPDDQAARQTDDARVPCSLDHDQEPLGGHAAKVVQVHGDGHERWACLGGDDLPVIETDDGHIVVEVSLMVQHRPEYDALDAASQTYRVLARAFDDAGNAHGNGSHSA